MYTLENIKDMYYTDLTNGLIELGFEQYFRENYIPCYDENVNFIGYERR